MGNVETSAKVVLWNETRTPVQIWSAQVSGKISSVTFPGMVLDVKGEICSLMFCQHVKFLENIKRLYLLKRSILKEK